MQAEAAAVGRSACVGERGALMMRRSCEVLNWIVVVAGCGALSILGAIEKKVQKTRTATNCVPGLFPLWRQGSQRSHGLHGVDSVEFA